MRNRGSSLIVFWLFSAGPGPLGLPETILSAKITTLRHIGGDNSS